jgi:hypothetical protein
MAIQTITTVLVPASSYDLILLATLKDDLNITGSSSDGYLARVITRTSKAIQKYCKRALVVEKVKDEFFPEKRPYPSDLTDNVNELRLSRWPIVGSASTAGTGAPLLPSMSAVSSGALVAATYYVSVTYVTATGETALSPEAVLKVSANSVLQVASPAIDSKSLATGWNVYVSTTSGKGTLQNASPISIGSTWTEPNPGLITGAAAPSYVSVTEKGTPLIEGTDFTADRDGGVLLRMDLSGYPRMWPPKDIVVQFWAGFNPIPEDIEDIVSRFAKARWMARGRDPLLRSENIPGVRSADYQVLMPSGGPLPPEIEDALENYRVPTIA